MAGTDNTTLVVQFAVTDLGVTLTSATRVSYLLMAGDAPISWQQVVTCASAGACGVPGSVSSSAGYLSISAADVASGATQTVTFTGLTADTMYRFVAVPQTGAAVGQVSTYLGSGAAYAITVGTAPAPPPPPPYAPQAQRITADVEAAFGAGGTDNTTIRLAVTVDDGTSTTGSVVTSYVLVAGSAGTVTWDQVVTCGAGVAAGGALSTCLGMASVPGAVLAGQLTETGGQTATLALTPVSAGLSYTWLAVPQLAAVAGKTDKDTSTTTYASTGRLYSSLLVAAPAPPPPYDTTAPVVSGATQLAAGTTNGSVQVDLTVASPSGGTPSADVYVSFVALPVTSGLPTWEQVVACAADVAGGGTLASTNCAAMTGVVGAGRVPVIAGSASGSATTAHWSCASWDCLILQAGLSGGKDYYFAAVPQSCASGTTVGTTSCAVGRTDVYSGSGALFALRVTTAPSPPPPSPPPPSPPPPPFDVTAPQLTGVVQGPGTSDSSVAFSVTASAPKTYVSYALVPATTDASWQQASMYAT